MAKQKKSDWIKTEPYYLPSDAKKTKIGNWLFSDGEKNVYVPGWAVKSGVSNVLPQACDECRLKAMQVGNNDFMKSDMFPILALGGLLAGAVILVWVTQPKVEN